ncbi:MAG TPA: glycosyltransferase [Chthoniobacterales bacterium]|nr:glycosyltransferase [Chthoniobacterales bacterium]
MKLNLFSPLPPTRSDIARLTVHMLPVLAQEAEIVVWCSEPEWKFDPPPGVVVRHYDWQRPPWREINQADATFYQMGNDPRYHDAIWHLSRQHPGIVILHDLMMQHFFSGLVFHDRGMNRRQYLELVERHHGIKGRVLAEKHVQGLLSTEELAQRCPLTEAATENALAVIVHSAAAYAALPEDASVVLLPLCVGMDMPVLTSRSPAEPYRLTVFGYLGPNRQLPVLLRALASFRERDRFRLDVFGTMADEEKMHQLICRLGVSDRVTLHGFVTGSAMDKALRESDLVANLRNPSMGEASGSQLHLWQYALPALVTRHAWYAALPEGTVAFVRPEHEVEDIQQHLAEFLANPEAYRELGRNGRRYVEEHHSIRGYASALLEVAGRAPEFQAKWIGHDLARRSATTMSSWSDDSTIGPLSLEVARQVRMLTAGASTEPAPVG